MLSNLQNLKNLYHLGQAFIAAATNGFPAKKLKIIGVTGTDGKTTTSTLTYHLLKHAGHKVALISTVAAYIGDDAIDTGFHVTSPDAFSLQRLLKRIVDSGYTHLVLESTSHGFDQHRLYATFMETAVITNITHEHLDYHRTYKNYLAAKAKIFNHAITAIINHDDHSYSQLKTYIKPTTRWIAYSQDYDQTRNFPFTREEYDQLIKAIKTRFKEKYNWSNALAAATAAYVQGVTIDNLIDGLAVFPVIPGRMQLVNHQHDFRIIVDFAHTPNALESALTAVKKQTSGRVITVFGAAGARDASKRPLMGNVAGKIADEIILTSEDPRHEDSRLIIAGIKSGVTKNYGHVHSIVDRRAAIRFALRLAKPKDTVIICGKGHEQSLNMDGVHEMPWSDMAVAEEEAAKL